MKTMKTLTSQKTVLPFGAPGARVARVALAALAALAALLPGLPAQGFTGSLRTQTAVGVFASVKAIDLAYSAAGQSIPPAGGAVAQRFNPAGLAYTTIRVHEPAGGCEYGVIIDEFGKAEFERQYSTRGRAGTTASTNPNQMTPGPHSVMLTLNGQGVDGELVVTMNGSADPGSIARSMVDIRADGQVEFQQQVNGQNQEQRFQLQVNGRVDVLISTEGLASLQSPGLATRYSVGLTVKFVQTEKPCKFTSFGVGAGCAVSLSGSDQLAGCNHSITISVQNAIPNASVLLLFGLNKTNLPLPFGGCPLYVQPLVDVLVFADAGGAVSRTFQVGPMQGMLSMQAVSASLMQQRIVSSNGLDLSFD